MLDALLRTLISQFWDAVPRIEVTNELESLYIPLREDWRLAHDSIDE